MSHLVITVAFHIITVSINDAGIYYDNVIVFSGAVFMSLT